jgi:hypothetical protein
MADLGYTGLLRAGYTTQEAWEKIYHALRDDETTQETIRALGQTDAGRGLLDASRRDWGAVGLSAPFEFIFIKLEATKESISPLVKP